MRAIRIKSYVYNDCHCFDVYRNGKIIFSLDLHSDTLADAKHAGIDFSNADLLIKMALDR